MSSNDRLATERVLKARAELIQSHTFYGVLVSNVVPKLSRQVQTMATNGKAHFYNPDFIMGLRKNMRGQEVSPAKLVLGVQRHESEHDARRHHTRRGGRDATEWNICTDLAINADLIAEGVQLPEGALYDPQYKGWSAEEIYRARELDRIKERQKQEQQKQEQQEQESQSSQQEQPGDEGDDDSQSDDQSSGDKLSDDDAAADEGDDNDPEAESDEEGAGSEDGQDDAGESDGGGEAGGEGDPSAEGEDDGQGAQGKSGNGADQDGNGVGEPNKDGDVDGEGEGDEGEPIGHGDPGRCGEVLDADVDEPSDLSEVDAQWERILRQAASLAAKRGNAPGHVTREIERADKPPQDWRETLRAWFEQGAKRIETWSRPNRRFVGSGIYLPGSQREGLNRVVFLIDTSGSMDDIALACVKKESQAAMDEGIIDEVVVLYGDVRVTRVDTYQNGDEIEFDPRGGGGTDLKPLFAHVRDYIDDASLIVAFTDLEIGNPGPEPSCPVLWAVTGYPDKVKRYLANTPWNAPGIDVGSH